MTWLSHSRIIFDGLPTSFWFETRILSTLCWNVLCKVRLFLAGVCPDRLALVEIMAWFRMPQSLFTSWFWLMRTVNVSSLSTSHVGASAEADITQLVGSLVLEISSSCAGLISINDFIWSSSPHSKINCLLCGRCFIWFIFSTAEGLYMSHPRPYTVSVG